MRFMGFDLHRYHYAPHLGHRILSLLLLPISWLYGLIATTKRALARLPYRLRNQRGRDFGLPIISVGNLIAGGSGKTPFIIALATHLSTYLPAARSSHSRPVDSSTHSSAHSSLLDSHARLSYARHIVVISRGFGRKSKGLLWVSQQGTLLTTASQAGDEPYLIARSLAHLHVSVIVCENRAKAILESKRHGANLVLLDDGFRFSFKKLDIILRPAREPYFARFIPSGLYRESPALYSQLAHDHRTIIAQDERDFVREVWVSDPTPRMFLLTAIANPTRLLAFLPPITPESKNLKSLDSRHLDSRQSLARAPESAGALDSSIASASSSPYNIIGSKFFPDHHHFSHDEIRAILDSYAPTSLLTTTKDATKLGDFQEKLSIMELALHIHPRVLCAIRRYIFECEHAESSAESAMDSSSLDFVLDSAGLVGADTIGDHLYALLHARSGVCSSDFAQESQNNAESKHSPATSAKSSIEPPIDTLREIEKKMLASIARGVETHRPTSIKEARPHTPESSAGFLGDEILGGVGAYPQEHFRAQQAVLLAWMWLPCDWQSLRMGLLDEALGILENAFYDGLIDFWLDHSFAPKHGRADSAESANTLKRANIFEQANQPSLSQSLAQKQVAWKYLYDVTFALLAQGLRHSCERATPASAGQELATRENLARLLEPSGVITGGAGDSAHSAYENLAHEHFTRDSRREHPAHPAHENLTHATRQNPAPKPPAPNTLSWDTPELFSLANVRIGLTRKGLAYCARLFS